MNLIQRERELADEIESLNQKICEKHTELDELKEQLIIAENKRGQIRRFIAGDIRKMMDESK